MMLSSRCPKIHTNFQGDHKHQRAKSIIQHQDKKTPKIIVRCMTVILLHGSLICSGKLVVSHSLPPRKIQIERHPMADKQCDQADRNGPSQEPVTRDKEPGTRNP